MGPRPVNSSDLGSTLSSEDGLTDNNYLSGVTNWKVTEEQKRRSRMKPRILDKLRNMERKRKKNLFVVGILILITLVLIVVVVLAILAGTGQLSDGSSSSSFSGHGEEIDCRRAKSGIYQVRSLCSDSSLVECPCCVRVYCDMETFGGGWTVFQRRFDDSVSFDRSWNDYRKGFGAVDGEFWVGNNFLYYLTEPYGQNETFQLLVELLESEKNCSLYARYAPFSLTEQLYFSLNETIQFLNGTAGDSLLGSEWGNDSVFTISKNRFSTLDRDNDDGSYHCAKDAQAGWWFRNCFTSNLNGKFGQGCTETNDGIFWEAARGHYYSFAATEMKLRPIYSRFNAKASDKFCTDLSFQPCANDCHYNVWEPWLDCVQTDCTKPGERQRHRTENISTMKPLGVPCSTVGLSVQIDHSCTSRKCG